MPSSTKTGYDLEWYTSGGTYIGKTGDTYTPTGSETIVAHWTPIQYNLTINANGGTYNGTSPVTGTVESTPVTIGSVTPPSGSTTISYNTNGGNSITSTTVSKIFDKWTLSGSGTYDPSTNKYTFGTGDGTLTATYKYEVVLPTPSNPGSTFKGWYTSATGGTKVGNAGDIYEPTGSKTLYAQWQGETYDLTIDAGEGTNNGATILSGEYEDQVSVPKTLVTPPSGTSTITFNTNGGTAVAPIIPDKEFDYWEVTSGSGIVSGTTYKFGNGNGTIKAHYKDSEITLPTSTKNGYDLKWCTSDGTTIGEGGATYTPSGSETIVASWTPKTYTITYINLNGCTNPNPTTYTVEDGIITLVLPNVDEYVFKGWYTTNDENTGTKVTSIDTQITEDIKLYAIWTPDKLYLRSEKYKVGEENDIDNYDDGDIYLDKIEPKTTLSEFIDNCDTNGTIQVLGGDGQPIANSEFVGTGMTIKVTKNNQQIILTAVVMGDLAGNEFTNVADGKITAYDLSILIDALLEVPGKELSGAFYKAADLDENEKLTAFDLSTLINGLLGTTQFTYTKPNHT